MIEFLFFATGWSSWCRRRRSRRLLTTSASALLLALLLAPPAYGQKRPPNYSPDAIPDTDFTCEDKITGGYYADAQAECQMFHVCVQVSEYEVSEAAWCFYHSRT